MATFRYEAAPISSDLMLVAIPRANRSITGKLLGRFAPNACSIARPLWNAPRVHTPPLADIPSIPVKGSVIIVAALITRSPLVAAFSRGAIWLLGSPFHAAAQIRPQNVTVDV